jgi:hypothetical protein
MLINAAGLSDLTLLHLNQTSISSWFSFFLWMERNSTSSDIAYCFFLLLGFFGGFTIKSLPFDFIITLMFQSISNMIEDNLHHPDQPDNFPSLKEQEGPHTFNLWELFTEDVDP